MAYLPGQQYAMNAAGVWTPVGYGGGGSAAMPVNMIASSASLTPVSQAVSTTAASTVTGTVSTAAMAVAPVSAAGNATIALFGGTYTNLTLAFEACPEPTGTYWFAVDGARADSSGVDLQPNFTGTGIRAWNVIAPGYSFIRARVVAITATVNPTLVINAGPFLYDPSPTVAPIDGIKATYSSPLNNTGVANAVTTSVPIWELQNPSASGRIMRVTRLSLQLTLATAGAGPLLALVKKTAAATGGTAVAQPVNPHDSGSAASTAVSNLYTAVPSGTVGGANIRTVRLFGVATVQTAQPSGMEWTFGNRPANAVILRPGQALSINALSAFATAPTISGDVEWTEEAA